MMHWSLYVLIGAALNAFVNLGYKTQGGKESFFLMAAGVMAIAACSLATMAYATKDARIMPLLTGWTPYIVVGMGVGTSVILFFLVNALTKGPIALVDPLWACLYAVASVAIGIMIVREQPSALALIGIGLYLVGAFLMSRG